MHFRSKSAAADKAAATASQVGNPAYEESLVVGEIEYAAVDIAGTMHQSFNTVASTHHASGPGYLEVDGTDAGDGIYDGNIYEATAHGSDSTHQAVAVVFNTMSLAPGFDSLEASL